MSKFALTVFGIGFLALAALLTLGSSPAHAAPQADSTFVGARLGVAATASVGL